MDYRDATPEDTTALADLGRRSFVAKFGHLYSPENLSNFLAEMYDEAKVAGEIVDPAIRTSLAIEDGVLMGYCKVKLACGWPEHARVDPSRVVELKQLYTDPAAVGRGIGGRLMEWALDLARSREAREMQISVYSENTGAHRFYERYGCEKIADIFFMVGSHRDDEFLYAAML
ncbi:GNAT family N-acetyltransferase [Novosphingobium sp. 9]|uniref:GNAT family N-acetyltransferase n=1 Tax=Novosphingobium sp. 9 TaxID=2025349 RepID=UPI0021B5D5F8|nr:GNAT family N-acetyltransferase [Novosphingobium sp. 9]